MFIIIPHWWPPLIKYSLYCSLSLTLVALLMLLKAYYRLNTAKMIRIIPLLIILVLIDSGLYLFGDYEYSRADYHFELDFVPDEGSNCSIIVPFLSHGKERSNFLTSRLDKTKIDYAIEDTLFGIGLNISSNGPIEIDFSGRLEHGVGHYRPTLRNETRPRQYHWIYSTVNGSLRYRFRTEVPRASESVYTANTTLMKGWQQVEFIEGGYESD